MRQKLIVGNWKMNGTLEFTKSYLETLLLKISNPCFSRVMLALPYTLISLASEMSRGSSVEIGAQNMYEEENGAFTGEVSASLIQDAGASFVILGHSERRRLFHETGPLLRKKILKAFSFGLQPILCIGETLEERELGQAKTVLERQLYDVLEGLTPKDLGKLVVAYEPVWAIGTGKSATAAEAEEIHSFCRALLEKWFGKELSNLLPIIYGGSVNSENALNFLKKENIDGALIGGASLDPESFLTIIQHSKII